MKLLLAVVLLFILNLAGCGSSGNPNAPVTTASHEKAWVTYHRNDIVSFKGFTTALPAVDGILVREHVTQCRACHGADLMGSKPGSVVPACFDCHVVDPVKYPVMCYSCHGGRPYPVMRPQQWYSTVVAAQQLYSSSLPTRPGLPLDSAFISRVRSNPDIHLKHKTVPINTSNINIDECAVCHGEKSARGEIHHTVVMIKLKLGCLGPLPFGCHTFAIGTNGFTLVTPDCSVCHSGLP